MSQEVIRTLARRDTESSGAGAYEREAGIKGPDDYIKALASTLRAVVELPFTMARALRKGTKPNA